LPSTAGLSKVARNTGYANVSIGPDSLLNCAGVVGGSLLPGSDLTSTYGQGPGWLWALAKRLVGGAITVAALPLCAVENYLLRQTSHGMLFAQRPLDD
jgi:hypothetical protein